MYEYYVAAAYILCSYYAAAAYIRTPLLQWLGVHLFAANRYSTAAVVWCNDRGLFGSHPDSVWMRSLALLQLVCLVSYAHCCSGTGAAAASLIEYYVAAAYILGSYYAAAAYIRACSHVPFISACVCASW